MKTKLQIHREIVPILNKEGRYLILSQYTRGGATMADDNDGKGYSEREAQERLLTLPTGK